VVGDDLYHDEDEFPPLAADLAAAIDELLSEFDDEASLEDAAVRELLWTVLERVGRLDEYRISETMGGWTVEDARDEEHRRQLIEEEPRFVSYCARELDEVAAAAIKFALALWIQCSGEWEELPKQIDDARAEVVSELQISVAHPGRRFPLEATKRDVERRSAARCSEWRPRSPPQRMSWPPPGSAAPPALRCSAAPQP
jgi:hypothetical protein